MDLKDQQTASDAEANVVPPWGGKTLFMGPIEHHEMPFSGRRIRNPRLRRGIFLLPSLFTGANLLCGYYAVVASLAGGWEDFDHAAKAIG